MNMHRLCQLIEEDSLWTELEQLAIQGVTDGGTAAMEFYRNTWKHQEQLIDWYCKSNQSDLSSLIHPMQSIDYCNRTNK